MTVALSHKSISRKGGKNRWEGVPAEERSRLMRAARQSATERRRRLVKSAERSLDLLKAAFPNIDLFEHPEGVPNYVVRVYDTLLRGLGRPAVCLDEHGNEIWRDKIK